MSEDLNTWWPLPILAAVATVSAVPIIILANLADGSGRRGSIGGSRLKTEGAVSDEVKETLRKIDPIDSLYFDVSMARHLLEEGDNSRALEWLDPNHALGELKKSIIARLLTPIEFDKVGEDIIKIKTAVDSGRMAEAHAIIVPLQELLAEKAYTTFKELDPVPNGWIDGRYESSRERKVAEWRAQGYNEGLIEKTLKWTDGWVKGIARRFIRDSTLRAQVEATLYPEALELSEKFIEAMAK